MIDVQSKTSEINIDIQLVGVKDVHYPIYVKEKSGGAQHTIGNFSLYANLDGSQKGTHMSKFITNLHDFRFHPMEKITLKNLANAINTELKANTVNVTCEFKYFVNKKAPVSKLDGLIYHDVTFKVMHQNTGEFSFIIKVKTPATSLCPCSKEISEYGAHNQRSMITVTLYNNTMWIEDIVDLIESSVSSPVYSILKRPDEKFVTEYAYNNPMFCEDIVRNIADKLQVEDYRVESENFESIHIHNAYACIEKGVFLNERNI